ncbi:MAG: hypothetical protein M0Z65_08650 [Firmicutes bacterium]|uniref:Uncharacterized protein n=1 Tax=Melghirimyces thermohalophilus TaxID=1236220 RepID=A0A1G6KT98_9BACL|nr:hypothetical protein [Melghirimyces thermohalophilus]MDA8353233.1 hypothetical protein [Bacillota bacterium]SDC34319.1 hypothetical protein SAMN04488112_106153 [Melghirimyces thermohalophilus]
MVWNYWTDMDNRLRQFVGRTVQVAVSEGETVQGQLVGVSEAAFTIQTAPPPGYGSPNLVTYVMQNIGYVRVLG